MSIIEFCDEIPGGVPPEASVAEAVQLMLENAVGAVAIVDDDGVVIGMFTERDVLTRVAISGRDPAAIPVADVMSTTVFLAQAHTTPGEAFAAMVRGHVRHLPVVDEAGKLIGILPLRNLLQERVDDLAAELDAPARSRGAGAA